MARATGRDAYPARCGRGRTQANTQRGGLIGIVVATGASHWLARWMSVLYAFDTSINLLALLFSAVIGVLFGDFPARRAARMDPIEALRHE